MTEQDGIIIGIAGLLFVLVALFTPIGAAFLALIGMLTFIIYKWKQKNS